ncbi:hypothetical protein C1H46_037325 [Malus baccata]|uniref:Uncharacterized protein n=1 Tax=Malus baccata TaxID=106549 RepID=A0A540KSE2_MALBA|nr:hypothetical protein C1H46_037325 [Malus baccata]
MVNPQLLQILYLLSFPANPNNTTPQGQPVQLHEELAISITTLYKIHKLSKFYGSSSSVTTIAFSSSRELTDNSNPEFPWGFSASNSNGGVLVGDWIFKGYVVVYFSFMADSPRVPCPVVVMQSGTMAQAFVALCCSGYVGGLLPFNEVHVSRKKNLYN